MGIASVLLAVLAVTVLAAPASAGTVAEIVAQMPAHDAGVGQPMLEQILKLGPAGLKELCGLITPPQDVSDAKARYALHGLVLYTKRPGAEADRANVEKALLDALATAKDPDLKQFFIEQLQLDGSAACIDAIGALLTDEKLCDPAAEALIRIGAPRCVELVRGTLADAKGKRLVTIVQALGVMKDKQSAKAILPLAADPNTTVHRTAWYALANIADASALDPLRAASEANGKYERAVGTKYYLLFATRLAEDGEKDLAAKICRGLIKTRTDPAEGNVVCGALYVLAKAEGVSAADDLFTALEGKNAYVRTAAVRLLARTGGEPMAGKIVERAKSAPGNTKADLLTVLGQRGDKAGTPVVLAAIDDTDPAVAAAAMKAAAILAPTQMLKTMTARMRSADAAVVSTAKDVLARLQAKDFAQALADAMADASPAGKVALLELLAQRGSADQAGVVFKTIADADASVRAAAAKALPVLVGPEDMKRTLELMLASTDARIQAAAQTALVGLCRKAHNASAVLDALAKADAKQKPVLLATIARLGGPAAMKTVVKEMCSADQAVKDAATRALTDWPTAEAIAPLSKLAGETDNNVYRVLSIRAIARIVGQDPKVSADDAVKALGKAFEYCKAPAEKNLVVGALGSIQTVPAVELAAKYLDDPDTRETAAVTITKIACPARRYKGLKGPAVAAALKKIVSVSKNDRAVEQAKKHLQKIEK